MATILYIEDNSLDMRLINKYLISSGINLLEAIDGQSGLEIIQKEKFDLILLDINLPDVDGLEFVKHLKKLPEINSTPIIALTANTMVGDKKRCLEAGCNAYIAKPIVRQDLYNMLQFFLPKQESV